MSPREVPVLRFTPEYELIKVRVLSFGYRWHPHPAELAANERCELVVDLRELVGALDDDPDLRGLTGLEPAVRVSVLAAAGVREILLATAALAVAALGQVDPRGMAVTVAFGSDTGRQRSVVLANALRTVLATRGIGADVAHHDVLRPLCPPPSPQLGGPR